MTKTFCLILIFFTTQSFGSYLNFDIDSDDYFEGDIRGLSLSTIQSYLNNYNNNGNQGQNAALRIFRKWPDKKIPYTFGWSFSSSYQSQVRAAMREIERVSCIKFSQRSSERNYIEIISGDGCYSNIGSIGGKQELSLGATCLDRDTILHELLHAIGFLHEQSRSDRDNYITIHWQNIPRNRHKDYQKYDQSQITHQNTLYDYKSVMHYPEYVGSTRIISPKRRGVTIESNGLSRTDIEEINGLYQCSRRSNLDSPEISPDNSSEDSDDSGSDDNARMRCQLFRSYCGWQLKRLNFNLIFDNALYSCSFDREVHYERMCLNGCVSSALSLTGAFCRL